MKTWIAVIVSYCLYCSLPTHAQQSLNIATIPSADALSPIQQKVINAYQQLGYRIYLHEYPSDDSLKISDQGKLDGELVRSSIIEQYTEHLIRVPVALFQGELVLICQKNLPCNKQVLFNPHNIIGAVKSPNIATEYLTQVEASANLYQVDHIELLHNLIQKHRINYVLGILDKQQQDVTGLDLTQYSFINLIPLEAYHYLHESHQDLVPQITEALANNQN